MQVPLLRGKGTPLFHSHLPEEKARSVLHHLDVGRGRQTGRLLDVHPNSAEEVVTEAKDRLKTRTLPGTGRQHH